ncbi:MAG: serine/threonine-protein kinase, partial [Polyangiales bacterium]
MDRVSHALNLVGNTVGGKYALQRVLGVGGMGAVYEAVHAYTNRRVALKILGPDYAASPDATARFLQEAQAPSSIGHPNIVEVLDAGEDPAVGLYLVLEYLDGEDMESAVEHGRLDLASLLDATLQLLDALGAAHARGFVHRDIKPANVFLVRDRAGRLRAKLLDFGIARDVARGLTVGNVVMGTPHYMAPEQAKGLPVDARADLWSVGAMLFHALAGVAPFDGDNPNVIMVNIILQDAPPLGPRRPDLSKTLVHAVDRALAKSPDARWPDAARMAAQLAAAPERLDGSLKITSTLRNRAGAVSGMRPQAGPGAPGVDAVGATVHSVVPPRPGTGTLGADDPPPVADAPVPVPAPAPSLPALVPAPAPPPPVAPKRRAPLVAGVALAVAAATLAAVYALRAPSPP